MLLALPFQRKHSRLEKAGKVAAWLAILALAITGMNSLSIQMPIPPFLPKYPPYLGTIPELGLKATSLSFYDIDNTINRLRFLQSQTKAVVGDLRLVIAEDYSLTNFTLDCIFYRPDGKVSVAFPIEVNPDNRFLNIAFSYGSDQGWFLKAGVYRVEIYYQENLVAIGSFEFIEDCFMVGKYTVCNPLR